MNRSDHQVCAMAPRLLRALMPSATGRGRDGRGYQLLIDGLPREREHLAQCAARQLRQPGLTVAHHEVGELPLLVDELVDLLFEGSRDDELVDLDPPPLPDPEG